MRRSEQRYKTRGVREVTISMGGGTSTTVQLIDQSVSGISLLVESSIELRVGQGLQVSNRGDNYRAVVRHIDETNQGRRVGLEFA